MLEQFANNAQSTLSASIASGDLSLTVQSAASFPTSGNFRIIIDSEIILVTAVGGTTFTVTRAQEGTTAAGHGTGALVTHVLTVGSLTGTFVRSQPSTITGATNAVAGQILLANTASGSFNVTLPAPATNTNAQITIKKISADGNAVTVLPNATEKIDGQASVIISTQYNSMTVVCDGTNWFLI